MRIAPDPRTLAFALLAAGFRFFRGKEVLMIDFTNAGYVKLGPVPLDEVKSQIQPLLVEGEELFVAFKGMRDYIAFTSKRIIAVNVQGITGKKKDFTSLPYSKIQAFSVESAGSFDL